MKTTWDGLPIHPDKPHGATILVHRRGPSGPEILVLHRAYSGPDYEGDWAWTPPSGARQPGETIEACARRELDEETGLRIPLQATDFGTDDWLVFSAMLESEVEVRLSTEHDRLEWLPVGEAAERCRPETVSRPIRRLGKSL